LLLAPPAAARQRRGAGAPSQARSRVPRPWLGTLFPLVARPWRRWATLERFACFLASHRSRACNKAAGRLICTGLQSRGLKPVTHRAGPSATCTTGSTVGKPWVGAARGSFRGVSRRTGRNVVPCGFRGGSWLWRRGSPRRNRRRRRISRGLTRRRTRIVRISHFCTPSWAATAEGPPQGYPITARPTATIWGPVSA
jgi:hypothetical protein